jgi:transketolase
MPGLRVIRPADANETAHALRIAVSSDGPTALVLTRQSVPVLNGTAEAFDGVAKGGYVLAGSEKDPDIVLVGTGSEVQLCVEAAIELGSSGIEARVVSLPSWELFEAQGSAYRASVLPPGVPVLAVEAGSTFGWARYADEVVGIDRFGASAPGAVVLEKLGFTAANVASRARTLLTEAAGTHGRLVPGSGEAKKGQST